MRTKAARLFWKNVSRLLPVVERTEGLLAEAYALLSTGLNSTTEILPVLNAEARSSTTGDLFKAMTGIENFRRSVTAMWRLTPMTGPGRIAGLDIPD